MSTWLNKHIKHVFIAPALLLTLALLVFPLAYTLYMSLTTWSGSAVKAPTFVGVTNFVKLLTTDARFMAAAGRTLLFTFVTVAVEIALGYAIALLLRKPFKGERVTRTLILLPVVATPVAISMAWMIIYDPNIGVANQLFQAIGLQTQQFLADPQGALWWLMVVDVWQWTPMIALILLAGLTSLPEEPYEAALVDGATAWQRFRFITFPLMIPAMFAAIVLRLVDSLKTFDIIYATTKGGPGYATETLNTYGFMQAFEYTNFGMASAVIMLFILIVLVITLITSKGNEMAGRTLK
ncbi:sugar ABC transporter permease [Georgenia yuyongxinii]|uniref:Sugar ABC transporter permease n=1 Tax=Georgenia yuyongxinii TaxID=2589797 RepID=A0A5B8C4D5_9MICO|nr:sugar ABC transporter permease [Georgenia yuyongxinii]QDC25619.1 sugar ABC transporter permease [Georgenia yuyongxinii]